MANIVLKQRDGTEKECPGNLPIAIPTTDGEMKVYTAGEASRKSVSANFASGDMVIEPDDGTVLSQVTVKKPSTLIPGNIKEDVNIAGILGTLAAAGGGSAKVEFSQFADDLSGTMFTTGHSLGVVPDLVIAVGKPQAISTNGAYVLIGYNKKFANKIGQSASPQRLVFKLSTNPMAIGGTYATDYDELMTTPKLITATAQAITFGNKSTTMQVPLATLAGGYWFAISGLV